MENISCCCVKYNKVIYYLFYIKFPLFTDKLEGISNF